MRNYVIINGVSSLTIEGLAINILPAITKPLMRNEIEEIDGRDGDLITELGYSAYDKEMEIGLWGNYDIDEIIKFFTGEGTVIFSTEPDKYYNFKILNQIDYDKLLKFRTATVVFHCQPFKYPTDEEPIETTPTTLEGEGETISFDDTYEGGLKVLLKGNTYQDSTTGKQLFNYASTNYVENSTTTLTGTGDNFTISATDFGVRAIYVCEIDFNTLYAFMTSEFVGSSIGIYATNSNSYNGWTSYANDRTAIKEVWNPHTVQSVSLSSYQGKYLWIQLRGSNTNLGYTSVNYKDFIISKEQVSAYEPYTNGASPNPDYPQEVHVVSGDNTIEVANEDNTQSQSYPINLGEYELCKIGDYQDRFFKATEGDSVYDSLDSATKETLDSNEWYLEKKIGKVVINSQLPSATTNSENLFFYSSANLGIDYIEGGFSNNFVFINDSRIIANNSAYSFMSNNQIAFRLGTTKDRLYVNTTLANNINDLRTWFQNNNTDVYYVLATPTYTKIEGVLASQLEAIYNAVSYEGQTNIGQTNDDLPFWIEATITFTPPSTIENIGNIYAKPILTITGSGNVGVVLNGIEILQINLGDGNTIAIDVPNLEAYNPSDNTLMNRLVTGDYMKLLIQEGENTLSFNGDVSSYSVTNYTRWI